MADLPNLVNPARGNAPPLVTQIHDLCAQAVREAGGYLVEHPEDNAFIVVFGGQEVAVTVTKWGHAR